MKIHFTASLLGNKENYQAICDNITKFGGTLVTDHIFTREISDVLTETAEESERYARKMTNWIRKSDIVVSEVSKSEVSVGYEITLALNLGKPVIVLYTKGNEPHALKGIVSDKLTLCSYNSNNVAEVVKDALEEAKDQMDVRFNFFISPKIGAYLDWISKNRKVPRAVYLRRLIETDMKQNKDYSA